MTTATTRPVEAQNADTKSPHPVRTLSPNTVLVSMAQLETMLSLRRGRIFSFIRQGVFPKPLKLGMSARWHRPVVEQWLADLAEGKIDLAQNTTSFEQQMRAGGRA
jgi:prophage regulatory protein